MPKENRHEGGSVGKFKSAANWCWEHLGNIVQIGTWVAAFALPAWAANSMTFMQQHAPASWVLAGFAGLLCMAIVYALAGWGRGVWVTANIRNRFYRQSDRFNPLDTIFQRQRIDITDLCNPMEQVVKGKKFLDCEMIGPANILFLYSAPGSAKIIGNNFSKTDAVCIANHVIPQTAVAFVDCDFERCAFYNVVLLVRDENVDGANSQITGLHWITPQQAAPPQASIAALPAPAKVIKRIWPFGKSE